jgi:hypothetical protein
VNNEVHSLNLVCALRRIVCCQYLHPSNERKKLSAQPMQLLSVKAKQNNLQKVIFLLLRKNTLRTAKCLHAYVHNMQQKIKKYMAVLMYLSRIEVTMEIKTSKIE